MNDKVNNLEEMNKVLERYKLPKLKSQEETGNMNSPISVKEIKSVAKNLPTE